jgi:CheY-like chemotaxis protein
MMGERIAMARIAIVDDSRLARTFAATCLRKAGHEVVEIDPISIFDVLTILREHPPQLLLLDYLMPGCPGNSLVRACHEDPALKGVPILVITAHHDDQVQERLERMGSLWFLHKPFEPQTLQDEVERILTPES